MLDMHTDMAGSAVALATIVALAQIAARRSPSTRGSPSPRTTSARRAYRPQEVIRALNGTTIQVIHSDAEGRMVLADTLALAARRKPRAMVDFATLTGACVYALTERMSGLFATDAELARCAAGRRRSQRRATLAVSAAG